MIHKNLLRAFIFAITLIFGDSMWAQTNPTAQSLPFSVNFGTTTFTTMPAGTAAWNGLSGNTVNTQALAEATIPTGNATLSTATSSQTTGGTYGYATSSNGRLYIQTSTNATNGVNQLAFAINTGTATGVTVAYRIEVINAGTGVVMGSVLQYRQGTSGTWTTVSGSASTYDNNNTAGQVFDYSFDVAGLSASTVYQFRWAHWRVSGGNSSGIAYDNINVTALIPAPITLVKFFATNNVGKSTLLSFSTATEKQNDFFAIERSSENRTFTAIGQVKGAGDSDNRKDYTYTDVNPLQGINYYRLRQVDFDGKFSYSPVVSVMFGKAGGDVRLSPQPANDQLRVTFDQILEEDAAWEVFDFSGRLLQSGTVEAESVDFQIDATTLAEGSYVLRITGGQTVITKSFQKK